MAFSFLDLAHEILLQATEPMTYQEIWQTAIDKGLASKIKTSGKTPWQTMGARLYIDIRDNKNSKFISIGKRPVRFFVKSRSRVLPLDKIQSSGNGLITKASTKESYHERDLHPLLTYFVYSNPKFNRGRSIYTKTIFHEKSLKSGYNEWIHPDMVGFYLPIGDWLPDVIEINKLSDNNFLKLFSFEIKKNLNKSNYRESYFQAVSNSSWAHEGYLVSADILQDDDLLAELERLASSFGIGIIHLDPMDIDSSKILYPAKIRDSLDWETINKLCEQNQDFQKFLQDARIDFESKRVHRAEYDEVIKDINKFIRNTLKISSE